MTYESNIFAIQNLGELSATYRQFEIVGLTRKNDDDDYDINITFLTRSLSYRLKHPVTVIHRSGVPYLIVREEESIVSRLPAEYPVKKGNVVYFKDSKEVLDLDFSQYTEETKSIILRFLQFDLQTELNKVSSLWQPGSGEAFFNRNSHAGNREVAIHNGFLVRAVETPGGGFGFCVDVTQKYLAKDQLKQNLTRKEFTANGVNKSGYVYHFGQKLYEIKPREFSDLSASECKYTRKSDGKRVTLLEDIRAQYGTAMPPLVAKLPDSASVLIYTTNDKEERHVAAGLCFKVYDTEDPAVRELHRYSIVPPFYRRRYIRIVFEKYLKNLRFGEVSLKLNPTPMTVLKRKFQVPDTVFGNEKSLSRKQFQKGALVDIGQLGRKRKEYLFKKGIGGYTVAPFERQLFVIPETDYLMYGNEKYFLQHLSHFVNLCHPCETGWIPEVITYDNRNKTTSVEIGLEILDQIAARVRQTKGGYAVVMLPSDAQTSKRKHDELAALVVSQSLLEHEITASIMHNKMLEECFFHQSENNTTVYKVKEAMRGKYQGYLQGVALNQVLLNNERWPFILKEPLHADLTIGIDVKRNIAGFTFIDKYCKHILSRPEKSDGKEKISSGLMIKMLVRYISVMASYGYTFETIVIHRDGRIYNTERAGIQKALDLLIEKGKIPATAKVTIVEIPKHAVMPFRLFEALERYDVLNAGDDNSKVLNPEVGSWVEKTPREAFICTTGREFARGGTSNPLYVRIAAGTLPIEQVVEDIYFLSCLPYSRPEDCSRYPLTIKVTDRRINYLGSDYDSEALEILKMENIKL
jgi:hypothetical protein